MLFHCESCKFDFESDKSVCQCPDCGKRKIRIATKEEAEEHQAEKKRLEAEGWFD